MMDYRFLEFLGNYFQQSAACQKQVDDFQSWMNQGGSGFKEIADMFKKFYGVKAGTSSDEFTHAFQRFQKDYMSLLSVSPMVPEEKYRTLKQKYETLKKEHEQQKKILQDLLSLSTLKETVQENMNQGIDQVMKNQKEIFEQMMDSFYLKKNDTEKDE